MVEISDLRRLELGGVLVELHVGTLAPMLEIRGELIGLGILAITFERETCGMVATLNGVPMGVTVELSTLVVMLERGDCCLFVALDDLLLVPRMDIGGTLTELGVLIVAGAFECRAVAPGGLLLVLRLDSRGVGVLIEQGVLRIGTLERGTLIMLDELLVAVAVVDEWEIDLIMLGVLALASERGGNSAP